MEIEKIEILVQKIDHAINIIQGLKDANAEQNKVIVKQKKEIEKIKDDNKKLKDENKKQKDDIDKINELHQKLEDKIQQILQYLPDEEGVDIKKDKIIEENDDKEKEKDEEILTQVKNELDEEQGEDENIGINFNETLIEDDESKDIEFDFEEQ